MKRQFYLISIFFIWLTSVTEAQVLPFTHYTTKSEINPLPSAEVNQVFQDSQGYIWFAIYSSGLVRYNGIDMETYGLEDGLKDLAVWDLIEDSSGRLWVGSNAGLAVSEEPLSSYTAGRRIKFITGQANINLLDTSINHNRMAVDQNHWLWAGTENTGIIRYRFLPNGKLLADTLSTKYPGAKNETSVRAVVARKDGSVWVALLNGKLLSFKNKKVTVYDPGGKKSTNALYETPDGSLWGGQQDGRVWHLNNKHQFVEVSNNLNSNISDITSDSEGIIWVTSEGSGVQKINPKTGKILATYTRSNGLLSNIAYNILEDREKNIWIAQSGGVSKLRYNYKAFRNITASSLPGEKPSLPSPSINTVLPSSFDTDPCLFWAGSSEGGISCFDNDFKSSFIQQQDGLAANWVYGMSYDQDGRLWIGSSKGINSLTFGGKKPIDGYNTHHLVHVAGKQADLWYYPSPSILAVNKLQMPADTNSDKHIQSVWFPAYHAIYVLVDNKLIRLDETCGLPTTIFNAASFDDKGYLWVATRDRGIYRTKQPFTSKTLLRIKNKSQPLFEPWWSTEQGAPTNQVDNLLWYQQKMWIGTPSGLFAVDNKTMHVVHKITKAEGLKANNATSFASSPVTHTLWVGTNRGLAEVNPESGKVLKTVTQYDGLVDNEVWFYGSVKVDDSGKVYFGTAKGVSIYDPSQDQANTTPPIIRLTKVLSDQTPGKRNEFSFEYAALSYANEHQIRYQTRLLGFDDEWSSEKTESRTNFTNLPAWFFPKAYTFEVRAVNESGIWSKNKLLYQFSVTPVWWLRWWAFGGYFIVFCGGVFAVDRIQRTRLIKKERENAIIRENQLKTETAIARSEAAEAEAKALQAENELKATELERARELEKAYYELKNTQNRLIQAEKMASLGRLSTGIAHELKNPLNFINNFAELSKDLVDELKDAINNQNWDEINFIMKDLGSNTQKIEEHGKRADSIVNAMMKNSKGSKARFEMANINDILSTYCDLAFNLKNNDKTRLQISLITDFDNTIPQIKLIPSKIGQALQNIIENAFDSVWEQKAKSNGHYIPEVKVSTRKIGENVEINITDNGPGIPKEIAEKIFEPFFTTKPTGQGTGLGLSFSYDIITQIHNGDLKFENSPGSGASFHIILPFS